MEARSLMLGVRKIHKYGRDSNAQEKSKEECKDSSWAEGMFIGIPIDLETLTVKPDKQIYWGYVEGLVVLYLVEWGIIACPQQYMLNL